MNPQFLLGEAPGIGLTNSRESIQSQNPESCILPGSGATPSQTFSLDEVRDIMDMDLAHEIATNPAFRLESEKPPETTFEKRVKTFIHNWNHLSSQLNAREPIYDHAIALLIEIKQSFRHIIAENSQELLNTIYKTLDEEVIRKQADTGHLDLKYYTNFIIQWMSKLCTRAREFEVIQLKEIDNIVVKFRRILEVLNLLKLDMANFLLDAVRKEVITYSVHYEKQKLKTFLAARIQNGFQATEAWLSRNKCTNSDIHVAKTNTLTNAYLEFLDWNPVYEYPETMLMDQARMQELSAQARRLCCIESIMTITTRLPVAIQNRDTRFDLLDQAVLLFENISSEEDLSKSIGTIWRGMKSVIVSKFQEAGHKLAEDVEITLKDRIASLANKRSEVRSLIWMQLIAYVGVAKTSRTLPPVPPGYTDVSDELQSLAKTFKRVTEYNYSVFGEHYEKILDALEFESGSQASIVDSTEETMLDDSKPTLKTSFNDSNSIQEVLPKDPEPTQDPISNAETTNYGD